ncbi:hypothetical protein EV421DRAFT_1684191, partial [Armillaria borealis]
HNTSLPRIKSTRRMKLQRYPFAEDHPMAGTHHVLCRPADEKYVPNFVGGMLPRCDVGDRDFYCSTMLTLFVPWRSGRQLKEEHVSWIEAFDSRVFPPWQQRIMKNFNLRYECLDARDDYHAQMTKETVKDMHPMFSMDETGEAIMEFDANGNDLSVDDYGVNSEEHSTIIHGVSYRRKMVKAAKIQRIMGTNGCNW